MISMPTPALVAPIEFTLRLSDYRTLGGHMEHIKPVDEVTVGKQRTIQKDAHTHDPMAHANYRWAKDNKV